MKIYQCTHQYMSTITCKSFLAVTVVFCVKFSFLCIYDLLLLFGRADRVRLSTRPVDGAWQCQRGQ